MGKTPDYDCEYPDCYCTEDGIDGDWEWLPAHGYWQCNECGDQD